MVRVIDLRKHSQRKWRKWVATVIGIGALSFSGIAMAQYDDSVSGGVDSWWARNGVFLEPGVTYERGDRSADLPVVRDLGGKATGKTDGFGLMGRAGLQIYDIIFGGVDVRYSWPYYSNTTPAFRKMADQWNWGPFLGAQTPWWGLRVWGSWIAGGEMDPRESRGYDFRFKDGNGWRVGVGGRYLFVSVNLEYQEIRYGKLDVQGRGNYPGNASFGSVKDTAKTWILSTSFPISL